MAVTEQVEGVAFKKVISPPLTVHVADVKELIVTAKPEDAVAEKAYDGPTTCVAGEVKEMV